MTNSVDFQHKMILTSRMKWAKCIFFKEWQTFSSPPLWYYWWWHINTTVYRFLFVSLCPSQRVCSFISIWSIKLFEAHSLVWTPWCEVVYAVCFGWSTSLKHDLPASHPSWPPWLWWMHCFGLSLVQKRPWSISSSLQPQTSSLITRI